MSENTGARVRHQTISQDSLNALQRGEKVPIWVGGSTYIVLHKERP